MTKNPAEVKKLALHLLGYVVGTKELCLQYGREPSQGSVFVACKHDQVVGQTDSSFAPAGEKSHEATFVFVNHHLIGWLTCRQPFMTASTAETELLSVMTGFSFGRALCYLVEDLRGMTPELLVQNDNTAAISVVAGDSTNWRSRRLRIRSEVLRQEVRAGSLILSHIPGERNVSDAGTKSLSVARLRKLRDGIGLIVVVPGAGSGGVGSVVAARKLQTAILALTLAAAAGQPHAHRDEGSTELCVLMFLVACTAIALWEAGRFVVRFLVRVCRRELPEPEVEAEGETPAEDQPLREDDLVDEPSPNSPVSGVGGASGSADPAAGLHQVPRFDSGDPQAVEAAFRLLEQGQSFFLQYVDDELYVGPTASQDHAREARDRELERLLETGAVQITETEAPSSSEEPILRRRRGLPVYAPETDNEPEVPAEDRRGLAATPIRVGGNFTAVRDNGGRWVGSYEEIVGEVERRGNPRPGLLNNSPVPPIILRSDWPPAPLQPTLRYLSQNASAWGGRDSALRQLRPNERCARDEWRVPVDRPQVLIRWHFAGRRLLFCPAAWPSHPVTLDRLTGRRRTLAVLEDGRTVLLDDCWRDRGQARRDMWEDFFCLWSGRTELEITRDETPDVD